MHVFPVIGNGDCLFHSFIVGLMLAQEQGRLKNLFKDKERRATMLEIIQKQSPDMNLRGSMHSILNRFLDKFKDPENNIDWVKLQLTLAPLFREQVVEKVKNNSKYRALTLHFLKNAIIRSLEISTPDEILVEDCFSDNQIVIHKISEMQRNENLSLDEKKNELNKWFETEGLSQFLTLPNGISNIGSYAGELEARVLSSLYNIRIYYYSSGYSNKENGQIIEGFRETSSRSPMVTFHFLIQHLHWSFLFNQNNKKIQDMVEHYRPSLQKYQESQFHYPELNQFDSNAQRRDMAPSIPIPSNSLPEREESSFDGARYFSICAAISIGLMLSAHCILPMASTILHCASWLNFLINGMFSIVLALYITEKHQSQHGNSLLTQLNEPYHIVPASASEHTLEPAIEMQDRGEPSEPSARALIFSSLSARPDQDASHLPKVAEISQSTPKVILALG